MIKENAVQKITGLSIKELREKLDNNEVSSSEITNAYLKNIL